MFMGFGLYDGERPPLCDSPHDFDMDCSGESLRDADPELKNITLALSYVGFFIILTWVIIFFYETKKRGYV